MAEQIPPTFAQSENSKIRRNKPLFPGSFRIFFTDLFIRSTLKQQQNASSQTMGERNLNLTLNCKTRFLYKNDTVEELLVCDS